MKQYQSLPLSNAHRLINHGPVVLIATRSKKGIYNIAPVAWHSPVSKDPPRLVIVLGKRHATTDAVLHTQHFAASIPSKKQVSLVAQTGKASGNDIDKFSDFSISSFPAASIDVRIPHDVIGYLECRVETKIPAGNVILFISTILGAYVDNTVFKNRLLVEKEEAKTLHHLGDNYFAVPDNNIIM